MLFHIVIFAGFDELDAIAPFEVLHNAATAGADARVALVTADGAETVTAAHGLRVLGERPAGRGRTAGCGDHRRWWLD